MIESAYVPVVVPELSVVNGTISISCWLVEPLEAVEAGDRVVELLAEGITFDVEAPAAGVLARIEIAVGAVNVGDVLAWIEPA